MKTIKEREMSLFNIKNSQLSLEIDSFGAEIKSLKKNATQTEYMWNADPKYWKRTSPVLFPIVGSLKNGKYTYNKKEYKMSQHGFARDMEFELKSQSEDEIVFLLKANSETLAKYPFNFRLICSFQLKNDTIVVGWKVENTDDKTIHFSIGAHPAFYCNKSETVLSMNAENLKYSLVNPDGLYTPQKYDVESSFVLHDNIFDKDALIIENSNVTEVSLSDNGKTYLTMKFDAPLFGIWSPIKKNAPFVCIEPWYGRCDAEDFDGDITEREWNNSLEVNDNWYKEYEIIIHE